MESAWVFSVGFYLGISWVLEPKISIFNIIFQTSTTRQTLWLRACLHGGWGPQEGEVTRLGGVTRLSVSI